MPIHANIRAWFHASIRANIRVGFHASIRVLIRVPIHANIRVGFRASIRANIRVGFRASIRVYLSNIMINKYILFIPPFNPRPDHAIALHPCGEWMVILQVFPRPLFSHSRQELY